MCSHGAAFILRMPESFEALLVLLEGDRYEIKQGKQPSFCKAGQADEGRGWN